MRRVEPKSSVQSVERATNILWLLASRPNGAPLIYISEELGLNRSTAHRILTTLMAAGLVTQDHETDRYKLGFGVVEMSSSVLNSLDVRREAAYSLENLAHTAQEIIHLGILGEGEVVYVDKKEAGNRLEMYSAIGRRAPLHCTGLGKALLAFLPDSVIRDIVDSKGLHRYTKNTITSFEGLQREIEVIRARRYAIDNEEHEVGIRCLAAPIFNYAGKVIASVSIAGPAGRMTDQKLKSLVPHILQESEAISNRMGFSPDVFTGVV